MFEIFTKLADLIVKDLLNQDLTATWAKALHFFIEDTTKIFALLVILIYIISFLRSSLDTERVRKYLEGKHRFVGYILAALFGAITPFCSCSSIPLFIAFTTSRIPIGITMAFLITSPIINEIAVVLLGGVLGIEFTVYYVIIGLLAGILGGMFFDFIKAERYLTNIALDKLDNKDGKTDTIGHQEWTIKKRDAYAREEVYWIFKGIWKWVVIGVGIGAFIHGYVPENWITDNLGSGQIWSVPAAVFLGIPLYSNATGIIPTAEALLGKGLPVGTTLAFMMSVVAASLPEFMLLKQVMKPKLLVIFFLLLLFMFSATGWVMNIITA